MHPQREANMHRHHTKLSWNADEVLFPGYVPCYFLFYAHKSYILFVCCPPHVHSLLQHGNVRVHNDVLSYRNYVDSGLVTIPWLQNSCKIAYQISTGTCQKNSTVEFLRSFWYNYTLFEEHIVSTWHDRLHLNCFNNKNPTNNNSVFLFN